MLDTFLSLTGSFLANPCNFSTKWSATWRQRTIICLFVKRENVPLSFQATIRGILFGLDCNLAKSLKQRGRNLVSITERRLEILMRQRLAYHIGITAHGHLKRRIGVAEAMESDMLVNVRRFNPVSQRL